MALAASLLVLCGQMSVGQTTVPLATSLSPCGTEHVFQPSFPGPVVVQLSTDSLTVHVIPLVFHVVHLGAPTGQAENISDAQIQSAVDALNEDFRKTPGSNGDGEGVDVRIEFVLAARNPTGEPASGIVRVDGSSIPGFAQDGIASGPLLPGADQVAVKSLTSWMGDDYVNVFVVPEINGNNGGGGTQGFAFLGPTGDVRDGITVLFNALGTIGTLKPGRDLNRTLTHEMGHHFSLLHTFWNTDDCGTESDCSQSGDLVCDTPPTTENSGCHSPSCVDAQIENYMDYAPTSCRNAFTAGQRTRMRACLETVRSSLLESEGGVPVATMDLALEVLGTPEACGAFWGGQFNISNFGSDPVDGFTVHAAVEGVPLPTSHFNISVLPGDAQEVQLPEVLLLTPSSQWTFQVEPSGGNTDLYPSNNHAEFVLVNQGNDRWTMTFTADAFSNESSWRVQNALGQSLWSRDQFPPGPGTTIDSACIPPGCHTLTVEDSTGDGIVYGGSFTLVNALGDTLAHLAPENANFGDIVTFEVCANDPPGPSVIDVAVDSTCPGDLDEDGVVQTADLLLFLAAFGQACSP